jgi:hypothetical protein
MTAKGVQAGGYDSAQTVNILLQNSGNTMFEAHGTLQIMDAAGAILQNLSLNIDTFLPQTGISYPAYVKGKALGPGNYQVSLTLYYGNGHVLNYRTTFTVTQAQVAQTFGTSPGLQTPWGSTNLPLWVIILIGIAVLIVLFTIGQKIYVWIVGRRRKKENTTTQQTEDPGREPDIPRKNKVA